MLFNGFRFAPIDDYLQLMTAGGRFVDRSIAEATSDLKQIIPYVYLRHENRIFVYRRRRGGAEAGLWDRASVGFGGHINPTDAGGDSRRTVEACVQRELAEELTISAPGALQPIGILNDDDDPVGARHLGLVFRLSLESPKLRIRERHSIARAGRGFATARAMKKWLGGMESWSEILLTAQAGRCFNSSA